MAPQTENDTFVTPRNKRRNPFDNLDNGLDDMSDSVPRAPRKRARSFPEGLDNEGFSRPQNPERDGDLAITIPEAPSQIETPTISQANKGDPVDILLLFVEKAIKQPNRFQVKLSYRSNEYKEIMTGLGLGDCSGVLGEPLWLTWTQYGKMQKFGLVGEVLQFPDDFEEKMAKFDAEEEDGNFSV